MMNPLKYKKIHDKIVTIRLKDGRPWPGFYLKVKKYHRRKTYNTYLNHIFLYSKSEQYPLFECKIEDMGGLADPDCILTIEGNLAIFDINNKYRVIYDTENKNIITTKEKN